MADGILRVDLFVEDSAHEGFGLALIERLGREEGLRVAVVTRSGRGGKARALGELRAFQKGLHAGHLTARVPEIMAVMIDANDIGWHARRSEVENEIDGEVFPRSVIGCPDPYVERWLLADEPSFSSVVGAAPRRLGGAPSQEDYKRVLDDALSRGSVVALGGIPDLAPDLIDSMDLFRAGRNCPSLKDFMDGLRAALRDAGRATLGGTDS